MTKKLTKVYELHAEIRRFMKICGCWPLDQSYVTFYLAFIYFTIEMIFVMADLVNVFGDISLVVDNLAESSLQIMVGVQLWVLRHSVSIANVLKQIEDSAYEKNYRDENELSLYLEYNDLARNFVRLFGTFALIPEVVYFFRPFEDIIKAAIRNETMPYGLPYRINLSFDITNTATYALVYFSQIPIMYYAWFHSLSVCFLFTIIVHIAGQLSVLAYRIRNINKDFRNDPYNIESAFRDLAITHIQIIKTATRVDDVYNWILLEELVLTVGLIAFAAYIVLSKSLEIPSWFEVISFNIYLLSSVGLILIYCVLGDFLIRESMNVENAFYECQWHTMPTTFKQHMLIFMNRARRPLQLTAGKFYIFELAGFCGVSVFICHHGSAFRKLLWYLKPQWHTYQCYVQWFNG